jgi:hypothetical protein
MPIRVAFVAPRDVTDSLATRIWSEAEAIWGPAGLAFEWDRITSSDQARRDAIQVTIETEPAKVDSERPLGWLTFRDDAPDPSIHLSRTAAEEMLRQTPGSADSTIESHEALIGRALGRVLAHEFGHYLLRSKVHERRGLMRAAWTADQVFALKRDNFELTLQQRALAATHRRME